MTCVEELREAFHQCMPLFIALGDEVRLTILGALTGNKSFGKGGMNVNQITEKTHLSRPAISHHLKILKEAGRNTGLRYFRCLLVLFFLLLPQVLQII